MVDSPLLFMRINNARTNEMFIDAAYQTDQRPKKGADAQKTSIHTAIKNVGTDNEEGKKRWEWKDWEIKERKKTIERKKGEKAFSFNRLLLFRWVFFTSVFFATLWEFESGFRR